MKRSGFTLIELLVVIAVIAILVSLAVTATRSARRRAGAVECASNVRQLGLVLSMYEIDSGTFPHGFRMAFKAPPGGYVGDHTCDKPGSWWINYAKIYNKTEGNKAVACCPSKRLDRNFSSENVLRANYGVNQSVCRNYRTSSLSNEEFFGRPLGLGNIPSPSRTLLLVDAGYALINWHHVTDVPPTELGSRIEDASYLPGLEINKGRNIWKDHVRDAVLGRHPGRTVNAGFVDGSVDRVKAEALAVESSDDGYRNRRRLWTPK
jgi:prepilin-type N-terminal cleavage/methylation domain-containing protein/prepilin-type processing-associated H-X9-DG protein